MTIARELRDVAEEMVQEFGWATVEDEQRIRERLTDRDLLSSVTGARAAREAVDAVRSHAVWLLS